MSMRTIERWIEVTNYSNIQGLDGEGFERNRIAETIATRVIIESGDSCYNHPADAIDTAKSIRDNAESEVN